MSEQEPLHWQPLEPSQQTLEFMAHREEVVRQICSVFQISPQELGVVSKTGASVYERFQEDFKAKLWRFLIHKLRKEREA